MPAWLAEGIDIYNKDKDGDKLAALVGWYRDNATRDQVNSTPTLFINGVKHANMSYAELSALLDEQLAD